MKKLLLPFLLFLMFIPFVVNAETCDTDKISIDSITIESKSDNVEELDETTASGKNINLNLSMSEVGDNIEYKFVVKNELNEDYKLIKTSLNLNTDYVNYSFVTDDNSNIIKANSNKTVYLKVEYKNEVPDEEFESGTYHDKKSITLNLSTVNTIKNPNTGVQSYILILFIILSISIALYLLLRKKNYVKFMIFIVGTAIIIPMSVYALCKVEISIESNVLGGTSSTPSITFTNRSNPNNVTQDDEIELTDLGTFRVLSADSSTALLFPKYNLNIGPNIDTSKAEFAQAASIKGTTGQIAFSDSNYWNGKVGTTYPGNTGSSPLAYVVDSNCNLYDYIIRYQTMIRNKGLSGATVRLMKFEEANSFISSENSYMCNATFWLGSAKWGSIYILEKTSSACELKYVAFNNGEGRGFRPVVEVPISTLLN